MLAVSWPMADLVPPILIGAILSITFQLDVLNDRTPQPFLRGGFHMGTPLWVFNGWMGFSPAIGRLAAKRNQKSKQQAPQSFARKQF